MCFNPHGAILTPCCISNPMLPPRPTVPRFLVPMAGNTQANDPTIDVARGGANCRIMPGPHTQLCGGARHYVFHRGAGGGDRGALPADNTTAQQKTPLKLPGKTPPRFKFGSWGVLSKKSDFGELPFPIWRLVSIPPYNPMLHATRGM